MKIGWLRMPALAVWLGLCAASWQLSAASPQLATSAILHPDPFVQSSAENLQVSRVDSNSDRVSFLQTCLQGNIIGRGIEALKEWWIGWEEYVLHRGSEPARASTPIKAGNGHGFLGGEGKDHSWHFLVARSVSVFVASLIPLGALAAGGILWRSPRMTFRIMLAILLISLIFLGSAPPSVRKEGTTPLVVAIWCLFCIGIYLGAPLAHERDRGQRRSRADIQKEQQLDKVWDAFFKACSARGILELQSGRFSSEEVEGAEPRLLIAVPGLVFLHCVLNSVIQKKESMELPGGTCLVAASSLAEDSKVADGNRQGGVAASSVFSRLLALDVEVRRLAPLTDSEVRFIEARVLQVNPEPLADAYRETEINLVAGALISAATEVTQIPAFKKRMGGAMNKMVAGTLDDAASDVTVSAPRIGYCSVSGLPLHFRSNNL
jgi:hypothetical protein